MTTIEMTSSFCNATYGSGEACVAPRVSFARRLQAWFAALSRGHTADRQAHRLQAAYRDLPSDMRVDLGIDRRRA